MAKIRLNRWAIRRAARCVCNAPWSLHRQTDGACPLIRHDAAGNVLYHDICRFEERSHGYPVDEFGHLMPSRAERESEVRSAGTGLRMDR